MSNTNKRKSARSLELAELTKRVEHKKYGTTKPNKSAKYRVINAALQQQFGSLFGTLAIKNNRRNTPGRKFDMVPVKVQMTSKNVALPRNMLQFITRGFKKVFRAK